MAAKTRSCTDAEREGIRHIIGQGGTICLFCTGAEQLATAQGQPYLSVYLAMAMVCRLESGNHLHYSCRRLCQEFAISYSSGLKAWHWLEAQDWLRPWLDDYGQVRYWKLSPYLAWKGRPERARTAQRMWDAEGELTRLAAKWKE